MPNQNSNSERKGWSFLLLLVFLGTIFGAGLTYFFIFPTPSSSPDLVQVQSTVASQMFQIFFLLVVLGGTVGSVAYWLMKNDLYKEAHDTVHQEMETKIEEAEVRLDERILQTSLLAEAKAYQGLSEAIYLHYYNDFRDFLTPIRKDHTGTATSSLNTEDTKRAILRELSLSKKIAKLGLELFENSPLREKRETSVGYGTGPNTPFYRYYSLVSHYCYHCAVEQIIRHDGKFVGDSGTYCDFREAIEYAHRCLGRTHEPPFRDNWFDIQENLALCLALSSIESEQKRGKDTLRNLIEGQGYPDNATQPTDGWRKSIWAEYNNALDLRAAEP